MIYCPKSHSKNLYTIDPFKLKITQHQLIFHSFAPHCPQLEAYHNSFSCFHIVMTFHIFQSEFVHLRYMSLFTQWETFFINSPWFILIRLYLLNSLQLHTAQGYFFCNINTMNKRKRSVHNHLLLHIYAQTSLC